MYSRTAAQLRDSWKPKNAFHLYHLGNSNFKLGNLNLGQTSDVFLREATAPYFRKKE